MEKGSEGLGTGLAGAGLLTGALEAMARREVDGRAIRVAREAALALRGGGGSAAPAAVSLRDDLEEAREESGRLAERVAVLEARLGETPGTQRTGSSR